MAMSKDEFILSADEGIARDSNILCIGSYRDGVLTYFIGPNIENETGSFIVYDRSDLLYTTYRKRLEENDYTVKHFSSAESIDIWGGKTSESYNPLYYVKDSEDIMRLADVIAGREAADRESGFYAAIEKYYLRAILEYVMAAEQPDRRNFDTVCGYIEEIISDEENGTNIFSDRIKDFPQADKLYSAVLVNGREEKKNALVDLSIIIRSLHFPDTNTIRFEDITREKTAIFIKAGDKNSQAVVFLLQMYAFLRNASARKKPEHHVTFYTTEYIPMLLDYMKKTGEKDKTGISVVYCLDCLDASGNFPEFTRSETLSAVFKAVLIMGVHDIRTADWLQYYVRVYLSEWHLYHSRKRRTVVSADELLKMKSDVCFFLREGRNGKHESFFAWKYGKDQIYDLLKRPNDEPDRNKEERLNSDTGELEQPVAYVMSTDPFVIKFADGKTETIRNEGKEYDSSTLAGSEKLYTPAEALKMIEIREQRIREMEHDIRRKYYSYIPLDEPLPYNDISEIRRLGVEYSEIADIRKQLDEYDARTVPVGEEVWHATISDLKRSLAECRKEQEFLQKLLAEDPDENIYDDKKKAVMKRACSESRKEISSELYALMIKIATMEESIKESYTSDEVIKIKGEAWI